MKFKVAIRSELEGIGAPKSRVEGYVKFFKKEFLRNKITGLRDVFLSYSAISTASGGVAWYRGNVQDAFAAGIESAISFGWSVATDLIFEVIARLLSVIFNFNNAGIILEKMGHYNEASEAYATHIKRNPKASTIRLLAILLRLHIPRNIQAEKDSEMRKAIMYYKTRLQTNRNLPLEGKDQILREYSAHHGLAPSPSEPSRAMLTPTRGGIDLTLSKNILQTKNAGVGIKFYLNQAQLAQLQNAPGFVPVIINIQPMTDLRGFLGLNVKESLTVST